ncbi:MAG: type II toxin-antitoxin system HipA family toxin [Gammaproteobacteria bacterium]
MSTLAEVRLWGRTIGAVELRDGEAVADFQYTPEFAASGIEVAPLAMPLATGVYRFPELPLETFHGLPGLLADSLPDRYGEALIDAWLASQGRTPASFNVVERLCYVGRRGMGALEFYPLLGPGDGEAERIEVDALVDLASEILTQRSGLRASFAAPERAQALQQILRVGASAGGARAKALIAWNPATGEVRSGQGDAPTGFEHWLLKLDGVRGNRDKELGDPSGFGLIEYACHRMAVAAGVTMTECRLLDDGERQHFMTRRFDRTADGNKLHLQSLAGLAHYDYNAAGAHSYEQALGVMRQLDLGMASIEQQFRRMAFNLVARNQDDHVKNIAFLMDRNGRWSLSPAFDMTWSFNPDGRWTSQHQMTVNGKRDGFALDDFRACAAVAGMKRGRAETIVAEVVEAVRRWPEFAAEAGVAPEHAQFIANTYRVDID